MDEQRGLLDLIIARIPGLRGRDRINLGELFDREGPFVLLSKADLEGILQKPLGKTTWTMDALRREAERDAAALRRGMGCVTFTETAYPPLLRELYDPPLTLFFRGKLPDPEKPAAAVVGTRHPSGDAVREAYDIAKELGQAGVPVVSGLALGIDAMAHRGNLEGGGATTAVLGSGLDRIYPAANRPLALGILEHGGALLSEYPPGTAAYKWNFPARNRIIAGLARGTLIVQAPESSGALITAGFTLDQGRDLWVAPSGLHPQLGAGTAKLAADGAPVVRRGAEILAEWGMVPPSASEPQPPGDDDSTGSALASSMADFLHIKL